jgi:Holliday junction DNA helicase RuvA
LLLKISGVGAKMGLAILSTMSVGDFQRCVEYEDAAMLVKIPGVGKKTAERLIIEMRDKVDKASIEPGTARVVVDANPRSEAVDALIALGYKANEVNRLIGKLDVDGKSAEDIIRLALRQVAM